MKHQLPRPTDKSVRASKKDIKDENSVQAIAKETDPLISDSGSFLKSNRGNSRNFTEPGSCVFRSRRKSRSPTLNQHFNQKEPSSPISRTDPMYQRNAQDALDGEQGGTTDYTEIDFNSKQNSGFDEASSAQSSHITSHDSSALSSNHPNTFPISRDYERMNTPMTPPSVGANGDQRPPLLEIPEEIYAIRKSALQVLKPLTRTWVVVTVGFALTVLFAMTRWTRLLYIPYWFILLPSWCSHVGLLWCHILSAQALSSFISQANDNRQRPDSSDHINRTEYLPLLQRSLKFGLKTALLSFSIFLFEILVFVQLAWRSISLSIVFLPLWLLVVGGILDGIICKTQHLVRVISWILVFTAMILAVLKVDYQLDSIRWRIVFSPIIALLGITSSTLVYIVYGNQIGYYQLTESQLTAGNLYSLAALICIVLFIVIGEVIPLSRPVEIETRIFIVVMAPLIVCLVGMGAWVVSRDEFGRLLLYGGQAAVHPMKLKWESIGWTSVQSRGVAIIPMLGEVSFRPLERIRNDDVESYAGCNYCTCYPYEEEEMDVTGTDAIGSHPYLSSSHSVSIRANDAVRYQ